MYSEKLQNDVEPVHDEPPVSRAQEMEDV
jgi:hypothetical protein